MGIPADETTLTSINRVQKLGPVTGGNYSTRHEELYQVARKRIFSNRELYPPDSPTERMRVALAQTFASPEATDFATIQQNFATALAQHHLGTSRDPYDHPLVEKLAPEFVDLQTLWFQRESPEAMWKLETRLRKDRGERRRAVAAVTGIALLIPVYLAVVPRHKSIDPEVQRAIDQAVELEKKFQDAQAHPGNYTTEELNEMREAMSRLIPILKKTESKGGS
ncbi:MAG TPA: hypothetical protein VM901_09475 [Bdellovibrionota bacterium]|jgi:hypothetical protein|nr:hypothetical protein [Bdellovibrionota bacterium]